MVFFFGNQGIKNIRIYFNTLIKRNTSKGYENYRVSSASKSIKEWWQIIEQIYSNSNEGIKGIKRVLR